MEYDFQLDIYHDPVEDKCIVTSIVQPMFLYNAVSDIRKRATKAFSGLLKTHEKISHGIAYFEMARTGFGLDALRDPYLLLIPGSIMLATIGGAATAGRGKHPFRRLIYSGLFGGTAVAVAHYDISLDTLATRYHFTKDSVIRLYHSFGIKETITEKIERESSVESQETGEMTRISEKVADISEMLEKQQINKKDLAPDLPVKPVKEDMVFSSVSVNKQVDEENENQEKLYNTKNAVIEENTDQINQGSENHVEAKGSKGNMDTLLQQIQPLAEAEIQMPHKSEQDELLEATDRTISIEEQASPNITMNKIESFIEDVILENKIDEDLGRSDSKDSDMYSTRK